MDSIVNNTLPVSAYKVTKSLRKDYSKSKCPPPHVVVRDKKAIREPGSEPKHGNRVPYVYEENALFFLSVLLSLLGGITLISTG